MGNKRVLYVSDLDGTLLNRDQTLSPFTLRTVNALIEQGMIFSYATARSYVTASKATAGLLPHVPVIIYNGSFVFESGTQKQLWSNFFRRYESDQILKVLTENGVYPEVFSFLNGVEKFSYCPQFITRGMRNFLDSRRGDIRDNPVPRVEELYNGEIFSVTCIDEPERLLPMYKLLRNEYQCLYHKDIYSGEQWLEILPKRATKANAILELKRMMNCEKIVCFGDGKNDVSMFRVADECYAMENAAEELKEMATAVIESNDCDGVAKWLLRHYRE